MWMFLACFGKKAPPAPTPGTPEASLAAKPGWADSPGYAPPPPRELLMHREEHIGPLDQRMLSCRVETSHRGDRQRLFASFRNHDTTRPDMNVDLRVRGVHVTTTGPTDSASASFGAPAVTLDEGEMLTVGLSDRGVFREVLFDHFEAPYLGALPMELSSEKSEVACMVVPQDKVEDALIAATPAADLGLVAMASREVDLYRQDFGRASSPEPREAIEDMAAIVGWERVEVAERVSAVTEAERAFDRSIEAALTAEAPSMPTRYEGPGLAVSSRGMRCPPFGYHRHGLHSRCALELEVQRAEGGVDFYPDLLDLRGTGYGLSGNVMPLALADQRFEKTQWRGVEEGEEVLVVVELSDSRPRVLRFQDEDGIHWMRIDGEG